MPSFRGPKAFLSNFHPAPVYYDGVLYDTVEHAFQAAKTLNLEDRNIIQSCVTPGKAKRAGRAVNLRKDWNDVRVNIMKELVFQKFFMYLKLAQALTSIEGEIAEENEWGDTFWGTCDGVGENNLGKILMAVRDHLKKMYSFLGEKK